MLYCLWSTKRAKTKSLNLWYPYNIEMLRPGLSFWFCFWFSWLRGCGCSECGNIIRLVGTIYLQAVQVYKNWMILPASTTHQVNHVICKIETAPKYETINNYCNTSPNSCTTIRWVRIGESKNVTPIRHPIPISNALADPARDGYHPLVSCRWWGVTIVFIITWEQLYGPKCTPLWFTF